MSNSSELFSYTTVCSSFTSIEPLFFELSCTQTDRQTDRHTDNDEYSIVAVDKPQLYKVTCLSGNKQQCVVSG